MNLLIPLIPILLSISSHVVGQTIDSSSTPSRTQIDNQGADAVTGSDPQDPWNTGDALRPSDADSISIPSSLSFRVPNESQENAAAPSDAAPETTTYPAITATISSSPVEIVYSGEVLPVQTSADRKPPPASFRDAFIKALTSDPDTAPFGQLVAQMPGLFDAMDESKQYIVYAPNTAAVAALGLLHNLPVPSGNYPSGNYYRKRKVFVSPAVQQQFAQKPAAAVDLKYVPATLVTDLNGEMKYVDLGPDEGARIVSRPNNPTNGTTHIVSGLGHVSRVQAGELPFAYGIVKKSDSFFMLPRVLDHVLFYTQGRLWRSALKTAGLLEELGKTRRITVFAVRDAGMDVEKLPSKEDLEGLVHPELVYTPELSDGLCLQTKNAGSQIKVEKSGNDTLINGVLVVHSNVIAKNGVVHYLEKMPPKATCGTPGTSPDEGPPSPKKTSTAPVNARPAMTTVAVVAFFLMNVFWYGVA